MNNTLQLANCILIACLSSTAIAEVKTDFEQKYDAKFCAKTLTDEACSTYKVQFPHFSNNPWLSQYVETNVRHSLSDNESQSAMPWPEFLKYYAKLSTEVEGEEIWTHDLSINAGLLASHGTWAVIEFSAYEYHRGAAHGMPSRYFRVLDTTTRQAIALDEILVSGQDQKKQLEKLQYQAIEDYFITFLDMNQAEVAQQNKLFNFRTSEDWRPAKEGLVFGYGAYEIGPYVIGMPEVLVKKEDLHNIVQPEILKRLDTWPTTYE